MTAVRRSPAGPDPYLFDISGELKAMAAGASNNEQVVFVQRSDGCDGLQHLSRDGSFCPGDKPTGGFGLASNYYGFLSPLAGGIARPFSGAGGRAPVTVAVSAAATVGSEAEEACRDANRRRRRFSDTKGNWYNWDGTFRSAGHPAPTLFHEWGYSADTTGEAPSGEVWFKQGAVPGYAPGLGTLREIGNLFGGTFHSPTGAPWASGSAGGLGSGWGHGYGVKRLDGTPGEGAPDAVQNTYDYARTGLNNRTVHVCGDYPRNEYLMLAVERTLPERVYAAGVINVGVAGLTVRTAADDAISGIPYGTPLAHISTTDSKVGPVDALPDGLWMTWGRDGSTTSRFFCRFWAFVGGSIVEAGPPVVTTVGGSGQVALTSTDWIRCVFE